MSKQKALDLHKKYVGKLSVCPTITVDSQDQLSLVYTPFVADVCREIVQHPEKAQDLTIAGKTVAVISDGSAVLGLGNIGPKAALPVMEGKCVIFKEFAGVDAFPICLDTQDPKELIETITRLAPNFAAINLEDISAPRCFDIEQALQQKLDIPVMHDDQHGTAIVTLAALLSALTLYPKDQLRIVITGAGAAGNAIVKLLIEAKDLITIESIKIHDSKGLVSLDRDDLDSHKRKLAEITHQKHTNTLEESMKDSDVFIGVSKGGIVSKSMLASMKKDSFVFAMANPDPEILPKDALEAGAAIVATGRSDFPNQINNALAYPGIFKGLISSEIKNVNAEIKLLAAQAIVDYHKSNITKDEILPSVLDKNIPKLISKSIEQHAQQNSS